MSTLFAEIYEAIQTLREQKGVFEKDILKYIEERVGGCLKASNFMKTIKTLQKLVDDGILCKKGKRFMFAPESQEDEEMNNDEDECLDKEEPELDKSEDECDEKKQDEGDEKKQDEGDEKKQDDCDDEGDEDDDDDDDEDDDKDEEDDDDDEDDSDEDECNNNDDDDECDENDNMKQDPYPKGSNPGENGCVKSISQGKMILNPKKMNESSMNKIGGGFGGGMACDNSKNGNDANKGKLMNQEARKMMEKNDDAKKSEAFAFCVRDFIDSLYRPKSNDQEKERTSMPDILLEESMDATENVEEPGRAKLPLNKKRKLRKRNQSRCTYRSRSPVMKAKADEFLSLKKDRSDDVCFWVASNQFLPDPMDEEMEIDLEKDAGDAPEFDVRRHKSPAGLLSINIPDIHISRNDSSCNTQDKLAQCYDGATEHFPKKTAQTKPSQLDNRANSQSNRSRSEEIDKEQDNINRSLSVEDEANACIEPQTSLCSFCEKRTKNEVNA